MGIYISKITFLLSFQTSLFSLNLSQEEPYDLKKSEFFHLPTDSFDSSEFIFNKIDLQYDYNYVFNRSEQAFKKKTFIYLPFVNGTKNWVPNESLEHSITDYGERSDTIFHFSEQTNLRKTSTQFSFGFKNSLSNDPIEFIKADSSYTLANSITRLPDYRFNYSVFSWENFESFKTIKEEDALIPTKLLNAILKSNFELFFQQRQLLDEEQHAVYLNVLHGTPEKSISKANSFNFSEFASYLLVFSALIAFIFRYSNSYTSTKE